MSLLNSEDIANVEHVQAERDIMVFIMALCLSLPTAGPALKDGQNSHKYKVPVKKKIKLQVQGSREKKS